MGAFSRTHPRCESLQPLPVLALDLSPDVTVTNLAAPVALLLAAREGQLDLGPRALEVEPGGDQRQPAPLATPDQALDLVPVEEQLAGTLRVVVLRARGAVGGNVRVAQPDLS